MSYSELEQKKAAVLVLVSCMMASSEPNADELNSIKEKMLIYFHGRAAFTPVIIDEVIQKYSSTSPDNLWELIEQNVQTICPRERDKELLLADLEKIIEADGIISESESRMYLQIKNLLQCC